MRTLVFEQWQGGHYFNYLECLVPRLAELSGEVIVAITDRAASSERFARQLGHLRNLPNVRFDRQVTVPDRKNRWMFRMKLGKNVVDAIQRNKPDCVFLPSADEQVLALPLQALAGAGRRIRAIPVEAVIHYKSYTSCSNAAERMLSAVQSQLLRTKVFSRLNFVNFLQFEDAVARRLPWARMARAAGDPVPQGPRIERPHARRLLGLEEGGRYIGMIGDLDARKAVPQTLAAFRAARLSGTDRLLLAGKLTPNYAQLVHEEYFDLVRNGRLVVIDRFLTDEELAHAFAALDLHCSVYNDFTGLSSLMLKSVAAGVPVIVDDRGWARAVVRRFCIGRTADHRRPDEYATALREALEASAAYAETPAVARLLRFHSIENFTEGLVERVAAVAGRPPSLPVLSWSWVLESLAPELRHLR